MSLIQQTFFEREELLSIFNPEPNTKLYSYKSYLEKLQFELSKFELTPNECEVFTFLSQYGSKTEKEVFMALNIQRTDVCHILSNLQGKGIVYSTRDNPVEFFVIPLDDAISVLIRLENERLKSLEIKKDQLIDLWNNISAHKIDTSKIYPDRRFRILKGADQIKSKENEMISNAKNALLILGSEKYYMKLYNHDSLAHLNNSATDVKLLTSCTERTMYIFEEVSKAKIKKMPDEMDDNLCIIIKDNNELLLFVKNNIPSLQCMAICTDSISMIAPLMLSFNDIWTYSKDIGVVCKK